MSTPITTTTTTRPNNNNNNNKDHGHKGPKSVKKRQSRVSKKKDASAENAPIFLRSKYLVRYCVRCCLCRNCTREYSHVSCCCCFLTHNLESIHVRCIYLHAQYNVIDCQKPIIWLIHVILKLQPGPMMVLPLLSKIRKNLPRISLASFSRYASLSTIRVAYSKSLILLLLWRNTLIPHTLVVSLSFFYVMLVAQ